LKSAHNRTSIGAIPISSLSVLVLFKESWLFVTDNTNVRWVKIFQLYKGFHRTQTSIGFFVKGSARIVEPPRIEYKGFKYKFSIKGDIVRMLLVRSSSFEKNPTNSRVKFTNNSGLTIKKKSDLKSKYINGPVSRKLNRRKLLTLFSRVVY
jgi:large subunit ribosomal protein L14